MDRVASEGKPFSALSSWSDFFLFLFFPHSLRDKQTLERQALKGDEQERVGKGVRRTCVLFANWENNAEKKETLVFSHSEDRGRKEEDERWGTRSHWVIPLFLLFPEKVSNYSFSEDEVNRQEQKTQTMEAARFRTTVDTAPSPFSFGGTLFLLWVEIFWFQINRPLSGAHTHNITSEFSSHK